MIMSEYFNDKYSSIEEFRASAEKVISIKISDRSENKMKKYDVYLEKERMLYVEAVVKGDKYDASLHMGRMQGYKDALCDMEVDFTKICDLNDRIMSATDFAYHMRRYSKMHCSHYAEGDNE